METNRLMLGDWVGYIGAYEDDSGEIVKLWEKPIPIKITFITPDAVQYEDEEGCYECMDYELHPIPLTPEILEKNGFKEEQLPIGVRKVIWESEDTRTEIVLYMDDTMPIEVRKNIYYEDEICYTLPFVWAVHQLQHIIRLCDINKTIEI